MTNLRSTKVNFSNYVNVNRLSSSLLASSNSIEVENAMIAILSLNDPDS